MRYVLAKQREAFELKAYRVYVTQGIRALIGNDSIPTYLDMIDLTVVDEKENEELANEIITNIKNKLEGGT